MATSLATTVTVCCIFYTLFNMGSRSADELKILYACAEGHVTKQKSNTDTYILRHCVGPTTYYLTAGSSRKIKGEEDVDQLINLYKNIYTKHVLYMHLYSIQAYALYCAVWYN